MKRLDAIATLAAVPVLALLSPPATGPLAPLLVLVATAAWTCTAWLLLVVALTCGGRMPGRLGGAATTAVRWVAPASVRGLVRAAVGASLAVTVLAGPAALAEDRTPTVAGSAADSLDWPGLAPVTAAPAPTATGTATRTATPPATSAASPHATPSQAATPSATPSPESTVAPAAAPPAPADGAVIVRPGDSLWSLARQQLGPQASDRQVAQAWPRWWSANRDVIGDDPDLIHPGDRLTAP